MQPGRAGREENSRKIELHRTVLDKNKTSAACISVRVLFLEVNKSSVLLWVFLLEALLVVVKHDMTTVDEIFWHRASMRYGKVHTVGSHIEEERKLRERWREEREREIGDRDC